MRWCSGVVWLLFLLSYATGGTDQFVVVIEYGKSPPVRVLVLGLKYVFYLALELSKGVARRSLLKISGGL